MTEVELKVYVPISDTLLTRIAPGSGVVGSPEGGRLRIDFEGNLYGAVNIKTYADRCYHAADRHRTRYPTVARMFVARSELAEVGELLDHGVVPNNAFSVDSLLTWLGCTRDELQGELGRSPRYA